MIKKRILIIDDDPAIIELLRINLEHAGYRIFFASEGHKALEIIRKEKLDLIILDILLPDIDGYEICRRLREKEAKIITPILILSVKNKPVDKVTALKLGADNYMTKPFEIEELLATIYAIMRRTELMLSANPLTELPGNVSIVAEVSMRMRRKERFAFVYLDVDYFKAFNDKYGFKKGDEIIKFTAGILKQCSAEDDFIGHIGGDDFVLICNAKKVESVCKKVIKVFDAKVQRYFNVKDRKRGYILARDRKGQMQQFPLMTLSMGAVSNEKNKFSHYGQVVEVATEMKKFAKLKKPEDRSIFIKDKRRLQSFQ